MKDKGIYVSGVRRDANGAIDWRTILLIFIPIALNNCSLEAL
jgi:hypothetical protein